jgi:hypothetical protein
MARTAGVTSGWWGTPQGRPTPCTAAAVFSAEHTRWSTLPNQTDIYPKEGKHGLHAPVMLLSIHTRWVQSGGEN